MAIIPKDSYPAQTISGDAGYPHGAPRNADSLNDGTGFPLERRWISDLFGFLQSLLAEGGVVPSGNPDRVGLSQYIQSLDNMYYRQPQVNQIAEGLQENIDDVQDELTGRMRTVLKYDVGTHVFDPQEWIDQGYVMVTFRGCGGGGGGGSGGNSQGMGGGGGGSGHPDEHTCLLSELPGPLQINVGAGGAGGAGSTGTGDHGQSGESTIITAVSNSDIVLMVCPFGSGGQGPAGASAFSGGSGFCGGGGGGSNHSNGIGGSGGSPKTRGPLGNGSSGDVAGGDGGSSVFAGYPYNPRAFKPALQTITWNHNGDAPGTGIGGTSGDGTGRGGGGGGGAIGHFDGNILADDGDDGASAGNSTGGKGGRGGRGYGAGGGGGGGAANATTNDGHKGGDGAPGVVYAILYGGVVQQV